MSGEGADGMSVDYERLAKAGHRGYHKETIHPNATQFYQAGWTSAARAVVASLIAQGFRLVPVSCPRCGVRGNFGDTLCPACLALVNAPKGVADGR
jgi:hypothetical protein